MTAKNEMSTLSALRKITNILKSVSPERRPALTHLALMDAQEPKEPCPCTQNATGATAPPQDPPAQADLPL